jgi:hypothetical protein
MNCRRFAAKATHLIATSARIAFRVALLLEECRRCAALRSDWSRRQGLTGRLHQTKQVVEYHRLPEFAGMCLHPVILFDLRHLMQSPLTPLAMNFRHFVAKANHLMIMSAGW